MTNDDGINFELIWGTARGHRVIVTGFCPPLNQHNNRTINLEVWPDPISRFVWSVRTNETLNTREAEKERDMHETTRGIEMKIGRR